MKYPFIYKKVLYIKLYYTKQYFSAPHWFHARKVVSVGINSALPKNIKTKFVNVKTEKIGLSCQFKLELSALGRIYHSAYYFQIFVTT